MPTTNERRSLRDLWQIGAMVAVVIWSTGCILPVFSGRAIPFEAFVDTTPTAHYPEHDPETLASPMPESVEVIVVTYYVRYGRRGGPANELLDVAVVGPSGDSIHYPLRVEMMVFVPGSMASGPSYRAGLLAFADGYWPRHRAPAAMTLDPDPQEFRLAMYPRSCEYNSFVAYEAGLRGAVDRKRRGIVGPVPTDILRPTLWPILANDREVLIHLIETDKDLTQAHRTMVFRQLIELIESEITNRRGAGPDMSELTDAVIADLREALQRVTPPAVASDGE